MSDVATWMTVIGNAILPLAGGGLIGAYLVHRRDAPKVAAETATMDWSRFQSEITRLDKKVAAQDERIDQLEKEVRECHEERDREREERSRERTQDMRDRVKLEGEVAKLRGIIDGKGQVAQMASAIVAADRLEGRQIKRGAE